MQRDPSFSFLFLSLLTRRKWSEHRLETSIYVVNLTFLEAFFKDPTISRNLSESALSIVFALFFSLFSGRKSAKKGGFSAGSRNSVAVSSGRGAREEEEFCDPAEKDEVS